MTGDPGSRRAAGPASASNRSLAQRPEGRTIRAAIILLALLAAPPANAAQAATADAGLDLVVLVDRSESVLSGGSAGVADLVVDYAIDFLSHSAQAHRLRHRLAVVSFGSAPRVDLPLTTVEPGRKTGLRQAIAAASRKSLGHTDIPAAFAAAAGILAGAPVTGRRRALLLVTDGVPWTPAGEPTDIRHEVTGWLGSVPSELRPSLQVLLVTASTGDAVALWSEIAPGGVHQISRDAIQAHAAIQSALCDLLGVPVERARPSADPQVQTLVLPPYLEMVAFDVVGASDRAEVEVLPPDAGPRETPAAGIQEVRLGRSLRVLSVHRPPPGRWRFRTASANLRVAISAREFFPRGVLRQPSDTDTPRQFSSRSIAYEIVDRDLAPLVAHPRYPLRVELEWAASDGDEEFHLLRRRPGMDRTVFATAQDLELTRAGPYWTPMTVTVEDIDRQRTTVFRDSWSGFSVAPAEPIHCSVLSPRMNERLSLPRFVLFYSPPQALYVHCTHRDGSVFNEPSGAGGLLQGVAWRPDTRRPLAIRFTRLEPGIFRGWLPNPASSGRYRIRLRLQDRHDRRYVARFDPDELTFVRQHPPLGPGDALLLITLGSAAILVFLPRRRRGRSRQLHSLSIRGERR